MLAPPKKHKQPERIPVLSFARELASDLDELARQYPNGIYYSHLSGYYGESVARVQKAVAILENQKVLTLYKSPNNAYYVLPTAPILRTGNDLYAGLSDLQMRLVGLVERECLRQKVDRLKTNYSQLSRVLNCSYGGLKQCVKRLVDLEYIQILEPPKRGLGDEMIVALGKKMVAQKNAS